MRLSTDDASGTGGSESSRCGVLPRPQRRGAVASTYSSDHDACRKQVELLVRKESVERHHIREWLPSASYPQPTSAQASATDQLCILQDVLVDERVARVLFAF